MHHDAPETPAAPLTGTQRFVRVVGHTLVPRLVMLGALLCVTGGFTPGHLARALGISDTAAPARSGCAPRSDARSHPSGCDRPAVATGVSTSTGWCPTGAVAAGADVLQSITHMPPRVCWR